MIIKPQQKLRDLIFYNNLIAILLVSAIVCIFTSVHFNFTEIRKINVPNSENTVVGPIIVGKKAQIYRVNAHWYGSLGSSYLTGEVLDEEKDTLYEFGKDFWHEEGYDSEGHWSESDRNLEAYLTFKDEGKYYIQFNTENDDMDYIRLTLTRLSGSSVAHSMLGALEVLLAVLFFCLINWKWLCVKAEILNDKLEEMSDDD